MQSLFDTIEEDKPDTKAREMLVETFLQEGETYSYSKLDMVRYAYKQGYIGKYDKIDLLDTNMGLSSEIVEEYRRQAKYDVVLFNKSGNQTVCNEGISREEAIKICSSPNSEGQNYFAGFAPTGSYPRAKEGEDFIIDGDSVINPKGVK